MSIVGILADDADPMVSVMKVEKAPLESYADIGGLQDQVDSNFFLQFFSVVECVFFSPHLALKFCYCSCHVLTSDLLK